ncbi:MAG: ATP-grasp domain-containing protein [Candidatus Bathycorpusculaceae bacterium]
MNSVIRQVFSGFSTKPTVMTIGFNARPIACLAKQLGLRVVAVDYWGDLDITNCADRLLTVLQQKPGKQIDSTFDKPFSELLVDLAEKATDQFGEVDFILVGSGLDDRPDLWARLRRIAPVLGNTPEKLETIRNPSTLFTIARRLGINCPKTEKAKSPKEAFEIAKEMDSPVVLKPISGSGGFRIRFGGNPEEVKKHFRDVAGESGEVWVQEYVRGVDASSSIIGNGRECVVVSVNEQLVGMGLLGVSTPFGYCGNIVPLKASKRVIKRVREVSYALGKKLGLIGSNGFDFVIGSNKEPYLMEVNPRFQATLECIQYVTGLNLIEEHIKACSGELPEKVPEPEGCAVKMLVFAKKKSVVPDLSGLKFIFDIPHPGIIIDKGSIVCTVQLFSESRKKAVSTALKTVSEIYRRIY